MNKKQIKQRLDDAARYAKSAKAAVHYSADENLEAYLRGARAALDDAEQMYRILRGKNE